MVFKSPFVLGLIPFVLLLLIWIKAKGRQAYFRFPSSRLVDRLPATWKIRFQFLPDLIRLLVVLLFLIALAGPRVVLQETVHKAEGIDIVLAIDISSSMLAEDFMINGQRKNRLEIVKEVVKEFIQQRQHDRIGLVAFAALAYTAVPLTTDYSWLEQNLERLEIGLIKDGTAVGSAIASSVSRLESSDAKSKIIILLTDGVSNAGQVDPISAARAAEAYRIKIYTIGAGTKGFVPFPAKDVFGRKVYQRVKIDMDEEVLKKIAQLTGGEFFLATNTESLREVYKEIDKLEKTKIEERGFVQYQELFGAALAVALVLLLAEILLSRTVLLKVP
ncbi:MAG TPA: VWA domain-containing protein [Candidatus Omnitrophota bacterium]|nr:VWA domain-containing protein [Candidatus Omnitrophota bacterium]